MHIKHCSELHNKSDDVSSYKKAIPDGDSLLSKAQALVKCCFNMLGQHLRRWININPSKLNFLN